MPPKRPASPPSASGEPVRVYISEAIHDRKSVFIGYYCPDVTVKGKILQSRGDVTSASHRILGWRLPSSQKTLLPNAHPIFRTGHDDDGESWAGKKVENVMNELGIQGTIMVARWYGGELLGPVRFKHIEDVAKGAVDAWRREMNGAPSKRARIDVSEPAAPVENKTMTPEEIAQRRKQIIETLKRRDDSITTLRSLLEQKKDTEGRKSSLSQPPAASVSPNRTPDYTQMPLNRLQALENARDNTISFLLKSIDKAEAEASKYAEEEKQKKESAAALKAAEDEQELDEAWDEMTAAMNQGTVSKTTKPS